MTATAKATAAKAAQTIRAEKARAAKEDANWSRCQGCDMIRRWDGTVMLKHNRYSQDLGRMEWCNGSGAPPAEVPAPVFTDGTSSSAPG